MLAPGWYPDYSTIARLCCERGAFDLALAATRAGLEHNPRDPLLHLRLAQIHDANGDAEAALAATTSALGLDPSADTRAQILAAQALVLERMGRFEAALATAGRAILAAPESIEAHQSAGAILARGGDYAAAWPELAFFFLDELAWFRRRFGGPEWDGAELADRRLVVVHGQGAGDLVQMARYLPRLRERAAEVILEVPPALAPLFGSIAGVTIVPKDTFVRAPGDAFVRAMALPQLLRESGADPAPPYLEVDPGLVAAWSAHLGPRTGRLRVGLAWAGNPYHSHDHLRSLSPAAFAPVASTPEVEWVSLQVGPRAYDPLPAGFALRRLQQPVRDFADTAAIMASCDLVLAVDTAVAHVAGAIGAPVWLLLAARPEWRWPRAGERSPWYASMRLIHADARGWPGAIERAGDLLRAALGA